MEESRIKHQGTIDRLTKLGLLDNIIREAHSTSTAPSQPVENNSNALKTVDHTPGKIVEDENLAKGKVTIAVYKAFVKARYAVEHACSDFGIFSNF